jgi:hypothetical protein
LLCNIFTKPKEAKTGCDLAESFKEIYDSRRAVFPMMTLRHRDVLNSEVITPLILKLGIRLR